MNDRSCMCIKKRGQNSVLSAFEVFDYLFTKYLSKAHARSVSVLALLLVNLKVSKFQRQDISVTLFHYVKMHIQSAFLLLSHRQFVFKLRNKDKHYFADSKTFWWKSENNLKIKAIEV